MPTALLSLILNPKVILAALLVAGGFGGGWYIESGIAARHLKTALAGQEAALLKQCDDDKKITSGVSNEYESKITDLNSQLASLKRVHPSRCVPITGQAVRRDAAAAAGQPVGSYGVDSDALLTFAAEAEKYRLQLVGCQSFINKTWAEHGQ